VAGAFVRSGKKFFASATDPSEMDPSFNNFATASVAGKSTQTNLGVVEDG